MSNKGQHFSQGIAADDQLSLYELRVKKLGRIMTAISIKKRCQQHSWLTSTNGMMLYDHCEAAVVAMAVVGSHQYEMCYYSNADMLI